MSALGNTRCYGDWSSKSVSGLLNWWSAARGTSVTSRSGSQSAVGLGTDRTPPFRDPRSHSHLHSQGPLCVPGGTEVAFPLPLPSAPRQPSPACLGRWARRLLPVTAGHFTERFLCARPCSGGSHGNTSSTKTKILFLSVLVPAVFLELKGVPRD